MKQLSEKALKYLKTLKRDKNAVINKEKIEKYFLTNNVPLFEPVINYAVCYSGYTFSTKFSNNDTFSTYLISLKDLNSNERFEFDLENEIYLFFCGDNKSIQAPFFIDQFGRFCTDGYKEINIISSCFEIEIEKYAYKDKISNWFECPYYFNISNHESLNEVLVEYEVITECTDAYNSWFSNDSVVIQKGTWLLTDESYVRIFSKNKEICDSILLDFETKGIIRNNT